LAEVEAGDCPLSYYRQPALFRRWENTTAGTEPAVFLTMAGTHYHRVTIPALSRQSKTAGEISAGAASPHTQAFAGTPEQVPAAPRSPTNLPAPISELIGQEVGFGEILGLAAAHRLVTLTRVIDAGDGT
jgi:hypothetical protein